MKKKQSPAVFSMWSGSSPEDFPVLKKGISSVKKLGINLQITKSQIKSAITAESNTRFFLAGSDQQRANALARLLKNKKVTDILCSRGGYGNLRLLAVLDKMQITPSGPKRLWGYSDSTIIQHYLFSRFGWSWVHSPMISSHTFTDPSRKEKIELNKIFVHKTAEFHRKLKIQNKGSLKRGSYNYLIIGGNLMSLVSMLTSKWNPLPRKKFLLFIEDIGEAPYRLDRLLQMLSHSKLMRNCQGVIMGHFTACPGYKDIVKAWAKEHELFLAGRLDMGHNSPNIPHPLGVKVKLRIQNNENAVLDFPKLDL